MKRSLRNKHGQVWLVIAIFLPMMVVFSWFVVPGTVPVKTLLRPTMELMPVIKATGARAGYCVNIRSNKEQTSWQLEWTNKLPLTVPSAVIYWVGSKDTSRLVGRIEARGQYLFPLHNPGNEMDLVLYDFIHEKVIDSLHLKL
jgi:hypothetical protein